MRFNRGANVRFHLTYAPARKPLLLEPRHRCRDKFWIVGAHRDDGKRFIVHADEKLTAFLELESAICV